LSAISRATFAISSDLIHHRVDLAPHRQIVGAPRGHAAQMRENDPSDAVDDRIEIRPGGPTRAASRRCGAEATPPLLCMLRISLRARRLPPLTPQVLQIGNSALVEREAVTLARSITPSASSLSM